MSDAPKDRAPTTIKDLVIFDLDGTLCDCEHRRHFMTQQPKDHDAFYAGVKDDTLNLPVFELLMAMYNQGFAIWLFSGRPERCRADTVTWLEEERVPYDVLAMRAEGDYRDDVVTKREMLDNMLEEDRRRILFLVDDRQRVVDMWRKAGLICFQVTDGDF